MDFLFAELGFPPEQCLCENCRDIKIALSDSIPLTGFNGETLDEPGEISGNSNFT